MQVFYVYMSLYLLSLSPSSLSSPRSLSLSLFLELLSSLLPPFPLSRSQSGSNLPLPKILMLLKSLSSSSSLSFPLPLFLSSSSSNLSRNFLSQKSAAGRTNHELFINPVRTLNFLSLCFARSNAWSLNVPSRMIAPLRSKSLPVHSGRPLSKNP